MNSRNEKRKELLRSLRTDPVFLIILFFGLIFLIIAVFLGILAANDNSATGVNSIVTGLLGFFLILFLAFSISLSLIFLSDLSRIADSLEILANKK